MNSRKTPTDTTRRRCTKCGHVAWYPAAVRNCRVQKFGPRSYWCYGELTAAPITRRRARDTRGGETTTSDSSTKRADRHRATAARKLAAVRRRIKTTRARMARLRRRLDKQQRDERRWQKETQLSDAQLAARRERATHAAQVSAQVGRVRRRLARAAAVVETPPLEFVPAHLRGGRLVKAHWRRTRAAA